MLGSLLQHQAHFRLGCPTERRVCVARKCVLAAHVARLYVGLGLAHAAAAPNKPSTLHLLHQWYRENCTMFSNEEHSLTIMLVLFLWAVRFFFFESSAAASTKFPNWKTFSACFSLAAAAVAHCFSRRRRKLSRSIRSQQLDVNKT
jgi:hypothetical protein